MVFKCQEKNISEGIGELNAKQFITDFFNKTSFNVLKNQIIIFLAVKVVNP